MRIAIFRGRLTINRGPDLSSLLVKRLQSLGHEVLHATAVAKAGQPIPAALEHDLVSAESVATFNPEVVVVEIPDPGHKSFPRELIEKTIQAGGSIMYLGPAGGAEMSDAPAWQFLAERGFFAQSITAQGPRPIRSVSAARVLIPSVGLLQAARRGVPFVEVRTPYVVSQQVKQACLVEVTPEHFCTWDGSHLSDGMNRIAALRETNGREMLLTGDWLSPSSLALLACNLRFVVNLLTRTSSVQIPECAQSAPGEELATGRLGATLAISADLSSRPFVDLTVGRLRTRGFDAIVSCGDGPDLIGRIPGEVVAFVPIIDGKFSDRQEKETEAALKASRSNPDGFRIIPINFRHEFEAHNQSGSLHDLAGWVWLPGHDSLDWDPLFDTLVRVLKRPTGRFAWRTKGQGRRVFVSYSFRDHDLAAQLGEHLQACELDVFLADDTALMNAPLRDELARLIDECEVFMPLVTPAYRGSNWSFLEAEVATDRFRKTGRPRILVMTPSSARVPRWYASFPTCKDIAAVESALSVLSAPETSR